MFSGAGGHLLLHRPWERINVHKGFGTSSYLHHHRALPPLFVCPRFVLFLIWQSSTLTGAIKAIIMKSAIDKRSSDQCSLSITTAKNTVHRWGPCPWDMWVDIESNLFCLVELHEVRSFKNLVSSQLSVLKSSGTSGSNLEFRLLFQLQPVYLSLLLELLLRHFVEPGFQILDVNVQRQKGIHVSPWFILQRR